MTGAPSSEDRQVAVPLEDGRVARFVFTDRRDGDLRIDRPATVLEERRARIAPTPWTWMRQVHGATVVEVTTPGEHGGVEADAAVVVATGAPVAVHTADCAPVVLVAPGGGVAVVHAGWRGLLAGVIDGALDVLERRAGSEVRAWLGPCVHPGCYEFSEPDLATLAARFGPTVRSTTSAGAPALDVPATVRSALASRQVPLDASASVCTSCDRRYWSHRARAERERQAVVAWIGER